MFLCTVPRKLLLKPSFCKAMSSSIQTAINSSPIVVFVKQGCPYCAGAIEALKTDGRVPNIIEANSEQREELKKMSGSSSMPSIWVKGKYVGGFSDGPEDWMGIKKILGNKKLDELLA